MSVPARSGPHQEHALTERELRAAIDIAIDGMIVIDHAGAIVLYSAACERLFGYAAGEVLGRNVRMLMPSPYREHHDAYVRNYLKSGIARIIGIGREVTGCRKYGSTFPMHLSVGELNHARDGPLFVGTIHDLSERHRARARIDELQNDLLRVSRASALGTMGSALAHELNQPLSAIAGFVEASSALLDQGGLAVPDKVREFMDKAVTQSHRAGGVIRRLRELTRRNDVERSIEDINALVEEAC
ncbi:MAG: PAS domain S-box protein, partial [Gammaproteobacteria bacterium]|nr:PAS domain S-box protein [Gammaproteobacteria bacterium]